MGSNAELDTQAVTPLPASVAVGRGTSLFVDGCASLPGGGALAGLELGRSGSFEPVLGFGMPEPRTRDRGDYWWSICDLPELSPGGRGEVGLSLRARSRDGRLTEAPLGTVGLRPDPEPAAPHEPPQAPPCSGPLVAICMATCDPDPALLRVQIDSIRAQTHARWVCLISDDGSGQEALADIRDAIGNDPRFALAGGQDNAGFYRNFERALTMVPADADYVALADQDDRWRPEKLEELLAGLEPGARLVYADMRIATRSGRVLSDTYWTMRRNNHTDFASLFLANTVTGAAALFDAALLPDVLPFPPRHSSLFHDHWIAQVAMALGPISYVDRPLHDYVQHDESAIGHLAANGLGRYSGPPWSRAAIAYRRARERGFRPAWRSPYFNVFLRVDLTRRVLLARLRDRLDADRLEVLERVGDSPRGIAWLLARSGRDLIGANETLGRERAILAGLAWRRMATARARIGAAR